MAIFELTIRPESNGIYPLIAEWQSDHFVTTQRAEARVQFDLPKLRACWPDRQHYGLLLGKTLFVEEVRDLFKSALTEKAEIVRFLLAVEDLALQAAIHWETLRAPLGRDWSMLAFHQHVPFSRYLPSLVDRRFPQLALHDLRALVVAAAPAELAEYELAPFDAPGMAQAVAQTLAPLPTAIIANGGSRVPSLQTLCEQLTAAPVAILQLICHGGVRDEDHEPVLYLAHHQNEHLVDVVTATRLIEQLERLSGLPQLIFLASCHTANEARTLARGSLATRLVRDLGIPVVLAMSEAVLQTTAQALMQAFYTHLREHTLPDLALVKAYTTLSEEPDAGVAVLYSRLGARPLLLAASERLQNHEIAHGLQFLDSLITERAPGLLAEYQAVAKALRSLLLLPAHELVGEHRLRWQSLLTAIEALCQETTELAFAALARGAAPPVYDQRCPFPGLAAFAFSDQHYFFGRKPLVAQLVNRLIDKRFLALLGSSGSGKSSLVFAGLIPRLQQEQPDYRPVHFTPGSTPLLRLQAALAQQAAATPRLIVVDQFEELFTLCQDQQQREQFVAQLLAQLPAALIIVTMRADFWGDVAPYPTLRALMQAQQELIAPLTAPALLDAIEQQARATGLRFESGLSASILADVHNEPGAMPLLQHALRELWLRRRGRWLRASAYRDFGGVAHALAHTAEAVYAELAEEQRTHLAELLLRLVRLDNEGSVSRRDTRQRVGMAELLSGPEAEQRLKPLLARLTAARLIVTSSDLVGQPTVELAHEVLIRSWPRLLAWIDADRQVLLQHATLRQAALDWEQSTYDVGILFRGSRLETMLLLAKNPRLTLSRLEEQFLAAAHAQREQEQQAALAIAQREAETARRLQGLALVDGARQALASGDPELALALALQAVQLPELPPHAMLTLARAANQSARRMLGHEGVVHCLAYAPQSSLLASAGADGHIVLWNSLNGEEYLRLAGHRQAVTALAFSPDGRMLASAGNDKQVYVWDAISGELLAHLNGDQPVVHALAFSPDGKWLATASSEVGQGVSIWNMANYEEERRYSTANLFQEQERPPLFACVTLAFSPNGRSLACGLLHYGVWLLDVDTLKLIRRFELPQQVAAIHSVAWDAQGRYVLAGASDAHLYVWNAQNGTLQQRLAGHGAALRAVASEPGAEHLRYALSASLDATVQLWDVAQGKALRRYQGHQRGIDAMAVASNGLQVAAGARDGAMRIWDVRDMHEQQRYPGLADMVFHLAVAPDGQRLIAGASDGTALIWDVWRGTILHRLPMPGQISTVGFSPDGQVAMTLTSRAICLWDSSEGRELYTNAQFEQASCARFSADNRHVIICGNDLRILEWRTNTMVQHPVRGTITSAAVTSDGASIVIASDETLLSVLDLASGNLLWEQRQHVERINAVALSADSRYAFTAADDRLVLQWEMATGRVVRRFSGHSEAVNSIAASPDGSLLVSGGNDGLLRLWAIATGQEVRQYEGHSTWVSSVAFHPNGRTIFSSAIDTTVRRWRIQSDQELIDWIRLNRYVAELSADQRHLYGLPPQN